MNNYYDGNNVNEVIKVYNNIFNGLNTLENNLVGKTNSYNMLSTQGVDINNIIRKISSIKVKCESAKKYASDTANLINNAINELEKIERQTVAKTDGAIRLNGLTAGVSAVTMNMIQPVAKTDQYTKSAAAINVATNSAVAAVPTTKNIAVGINDGIKPLSAQELFDTTIENIKKKEESNTNSNVKKTTSTKKDDATKSTKTTSGTKSKVVTGATIAATGGVASTLGTTSKTSSIASTSNKEKTKTKTLKDDSKTKTSDKTKTNDKTNINDNKNNTQSKDKNTTTNKNTTDSSTTNNTTSETDTTNNNNTNSNTTTNNNNNNNNNTNTNSNSNNTNSNNSNVNNTNNEENKPKITITYEEEVTNDIPKNNNTTSGYKQPQNIDKHIESDSAVSENVANSENISIADEQVTNNTKDLFDDQIQEIGDISNDVRKSNGLGSAAIPIAVGVGGAAAIGIGAKVYKDHKENSELDLDDDRLTNENKYWTTEDSNVIHSEKDDYINNIEVPQEEVKYQASQNNINVDDDINNDTWSMPGDESTKNLLGNE